MTTKPLTLPPPNLSRRELARRLHQGLGVLRVHAATADREQLQQAVLEMQQLSQRLLAMEPEPERRAA